MNSINITLPVEIEKIVKLLLQNNIELYAVGGIVRDCILKRNTTDFDLATPNSPEEILHFLGRISNYDKNYGIITKNVGKYSLEIARLRRDYDYEGRHSKIEFVDNIEDDLPRRDFTVNALAVNLRTNVLCDLFNGIEDIENRVIRTVGDPEQRFSEDTFRILRAVSFAQRLKFSLSQETIQGITRNLEKFSSISGGLVKKELLRLVRDDNNHLLPELLDSTGVINSLFCESYVPKKYKRSQTRLLNGKPVSLVMSYILYPYSSRIKNLSERLQSFEISKDIIRKINANIEIVNLFRTINGKTAHKIASFITDSNTDNLQDIIELFSVNESKLVEYIPNYKNDFFLNGNDIEEILGSQKRRKIGVVLKNLRREFILGKINNKHQAKNYILNNF